MYLFPEKRDLHVPRSLCRPCRRLVRKHAIHACLHIHLHRVMSPSVAPRPDPVSTVEDEEHGNTNIGREERAYVPLLGPEDVKAIDEAQESEADDDSPRTPLADGRLVWEIGDILRLAGFAETQVDDAAADPGDETRGVCQVHEPGEDNG